MRNQRLLCAAASLLFFTVFSQALQARPRAPMLEARENLERACVLLEQTNAPKPKKNENAAVNQINRALLNLEEVKENKGSQLPLAIKDVKAAQAELAAADDDAHRAKALEFVQSALDHVRKGWDNRASH